MYPDQRETDYYAILNLPRDASDEIIQAQYRRLVKLLHPDRNAGDVWCQEQLKLVNSAYAVLSDRAAKQLYDQRRTRRANDLTSFVEELEEQILGTAAIYDERRNLQWLFESASSLTTQSTTERSQIEFVSHHAEFVGTAAQSVLAEARQSKRGFCRLQPRPQTSGSKLLSFIRYALMLVAASLAAAGAAYIASPSARHVLWPLLHASGRPAAANLHRAGTLSAGAYEA